MLRNCRSNVCNVYKNCLYKENVFAEVVVPIKSLIYRMISRVSTDSTDELFKVSA